LENTTENSDVKGSAAASACLKLRFFVAEECCAAA
jgi:hypothetical protein